jgi:hypothetical protein
MMGRTSALSASALDRPPVLAMLAADVKAPSRVVGGEEPVDRGRGATRKPTARLAGVTSKPVFRSSNEGPRALPDRLRLWLRVDDMLVNEASDSPPLAPLSTTSSAAPPANTAGNTPGSVEIGEEKLRPCALGRANPRDTPKSAPPAKEELEKPLMNTGGEVPASIAAAAILAPAL